MQIEHVGLYEACGDVGAVPTGIHPHRATDGTRHTDRPLEPGQTCGCCASRENRKGDGRTGEHPSLRHLDGVGELGEAQGNAGESVVGDQQESEREIAEIVRWRRENQPGGQNAGSVFVNPIPGQLSAGELIDRAGLRGFRVGGAFVSDKHANFIQAGDGATAADVKAVIEQVRDRVAAETGYELRSEVRLVGFTEVGAPEGLTHG